MYNAGASPLPAERVLDLVVAIRNRLLDACRNPSQGSAASAARDAPAAGPKKQRGKRGKRALAAAADEDPAAMSSVSAAAQVSHWHFEHLP